MNWKRIGRAVLCLLVVCCLIFNYVSTPAKAIVIADDIALGITALLLLAAAGMVIVPQVPGDISTIGESFRLSLYQWGTSAEKLDEVEAFVNAFTIYDPNGGDDDDDDDSPNETKVKLARGILAGIAAWIASTIMAGRVETEGEAADGFMFYNGFLLPALPNDISSFPFAMICFADSNPNLLLFPSDDCFVYQPSATDPFYLYSSSDSFSARNYLIDDGEWTYTYTDVYVPYIDMADVDWSNFDVFYSNDAYIYFEGTAASSYREFDPDSVTYFGDLPQKIQNGEADADDIVVPSEINYDILTQNGMPLAQSVVNTMNELATGKIEYDDYLDYIAPVPVPDPEPEPEPEPDPEPVVDPLADVSLQRFLEALGNALMDPLSWLANALLDGIRAMFVPSEDFITDKVNALRDKFAFADSIIETGQAIGTALSVGDSGPPVIYMHLQDAESDINWGGTVPALDMRWYERYKPTVDSLLSAMLWIFFAWRVFRKLPGIISGMEGDAPFEPVSDGRLGHYVSNLPRIGATSMRRRD